MRLVFIVKKIYNEHNISKFILIILSFFYIYCCHFVRKAIFMHTVHLLRKGDFCIL